MGSVVLALLGMAVVLMGLVAIIFGVHMAHLGFTGGGL